jgi:PBSX family phage portal protein
MSDKKAGSMSTGEGTEKLGRVHRFVKTDKGLFPLEFLQKAEKKTVESQQLKADSRYLREHGLMPPPFNVNSLMTLQDNCAYFDACVRQIAEDVVGQGYEIAPIDEKKINEAEQAVIEEFFADPNGDLTETTEEIIKQSVVDWGVTGWIALEVSRESGPGSKVNGLWHLPAQTIRIHQDKTKFCQLRDSRKQWFKAYGSDVKMSDKTGNEVKGNRNLAHEIIWHIRYYPQSDYYGVPNIYPAVGALFGLIGIRDYNLAFFENYGIPAALVTLEGKWEGQSAKQINDFLDVEIKGSTAAHKTLVLELPIDGKVTWKPLSVEVKEGAFSVYMKGLQDEVLVSYKMPPYRIGIAEQGALGGSVASEATRIYIDSIIVPLQKAIAKLLTKTLIEEGLDSKLYMLRFKTLDMRDWDALVKRWTALFGMAAINADYIRAELGLEERKDGGGDQYYISSTYVSVDDLLAGDVGVEQRAQDAALGGLKSQLEAIASELKK